MQAVPGMDPTQTLTMPTMMTPETWTGRVVSVGRWMMALGIIRLICASAAWNVDVAGSDASPDLSSVASVGRLIIEHPPIVAMGMIWLVALGVLVSRTHWPELLRVSSVVWFLLAVSGFATFLLGWRFGSDPFIAIGSFKISRSDLVHLTPGGAIVALLGTIQLVAELCVAGRSTWLLRQARRSAGSVEASRVASFEPMASGTRSAWCRGCWIVTLIFLFMVVRPPALPRLSSLIDSSPMLRNLLLMNSRGDSRQARKSRVVTPQVLAQDRALHSLIRDATVAWDENRYEEASKAYQKAISIYQTSEIPLDQQSQGSLAVLANDFAWMLVTRPDSQPGDPQKAVANARLAVAANPSEGRYWNTLGAAQYRAENWQGTKDALMRSLELRGDGDGYDWILFALLYSQTGPKSHALEWYNKAARWRQDFGPWDRELYAFEVEAAERLGLPKPPAPTPRRRSRYDNNRGTIYKDRRLPMSPFAGESKHSRRSYNSHRYGR